MEFTHLNFVCFQKQAQPLVHNKLFKETGHYYTQFHSRVDVAGRNNNQWNYNSTIEFWVGLPPARWTSVQEPVTLLQKTCNNN